MPSYTEESTRIIKLWLLRLEAREQKEFALLSLQWQKISKNLEDRIETLAAIEIKSENQLFREKQYIEFLALAKKNISTYNNIAAGVIEKNQTYFAEAGINSTEQQIELITTRFGRINVDAVNHFIGKSMFDGSPLITILEKNYPDMRDKITNILLNSTALGINPRQTASLISKATKLPLWKSLRLARTEQMGVMRFTQTQSMIASGVVDGKKRIEASDACDYCQSVNGNIYPLSDEGGEWHVNCRGVWSPVVE